MADSIDIALLVLDERTHVIPPIVHELPSIAIPKCEVYNVSSTKACDDEKHRQQNKKEITQTLDKFDPVWSA
jgi:hypothetical protein